MNCDFHTTYGSWKEEKVGGGGEHITTLIHSKPLPLLSHLQPPQLPVCTTVWYLQTGEDKDEQGQACHTKQTEPCLWYLQSIPKYQLAMHRWLFICNSPILPACTRHLEPFVMLILNLGGAFTGYQSEN